MNKNKPQSKCNGKCHLAKQIKINNETDHAKEENSSKKVRSSEVKEFLNALISIPNALEVKLSPQFYKETIITKNTISAVFVPPERKNIL